MPHLAASLHLATSLHLAAATQTPSSPGGVYSILNPISQRIAAVLAFFYSLVPNFGVAILLLSVVWMVLISPLTLKTTRSMLAMQKLQPQLKKLQEQHKNDRQAFAQAQMDLFREHNVSPFGSCLPTLLPLPVFFALFQVIDGLSRITNGHPNPLYLSHTTRMYHDIVAAHGHLNAFGLNLAQNALAAHSSFLVALPFYVLLLVMMGSQYVQTSQMMSRNPNAQQNPQMKMMKFLPLIFGVFCIRFPAGVVLYYAMSNLCRIVQQDLMYRFDPKVKVLVAQEVVEVEAKTRDIDESKTGGAGSRKSLKPASGPAPSGRSRLRDLLSAATEQQAQTKASQASRGGEASARALAAGSRQTGTPPARGAARGAARKNPSTQATPPAATNEKSAGNGKTASGAKAGAKAAPDNAAPRPEGNGSGKLPATSGAHPTGGGSGRTGAGMGRSGAPGGAPRGNRGGRKRRGR